MAPKQRLDVLLVERGVVASRELAQRLILAGEVCVSGQVADKPGQRVAADAVLTLRATPRFVSRGGEKLNAALRAFPVQVAEQVCADVGASTGGFTDCLLQHGARRVYAVDVGNGQLDYRLRQDPRVVVMERTNARHVPALPEAISLVTVDASFISLKLLVPTIKGWLAAEADLIVLVKPQFEAGRKEVGKGGVVRAAEVHRRVLQEVLNFAGSLGLPAAGLLRSPLKGPAGNVEFLAWLVQGTRRAPTFDLEAALEQVLRAGEEPATPDMTEAND